MSEAEQKRTVPSSSSRLRPFLMVAVQWSRVKVFVWEHTSQEVAGWQEDGVAVKVLPTAGGGKDPGKQGHVVPTEFLFSYLCSSSSRAPATAASHLCGSTIVAKNKKCMHVKQCGTGVPAKAHS